MPSIYDAPDLSIPDEPATFARELSPISQPKTMLQELWENEPMEAIEGSEPVEEEDSLIPFEDPEFLEAETSVLMEKAFVSHDKALRRLSADIDQYIDWFCHRVPFKDISTVFWMVTEEGAEYVYITHTDLFQFDIALTYICLRLELDHQIPSFHCFYGKMIRLIEHREQFGDWFRTIHARAVSIAEENGIRHVYDFMRAYSELYLSGRFD